MARPTPAAGGFFLILAILAGFGFGVRAGNPVGGTLIGVIAGTAVAVLVWLIDSIRIARRQAPNGSSLDRRPPDLPKRDADRPKSRGR